MVDKIVQIYCNSTCADCKRQRSSWASVSIGVFLCIDCAGIHRSFGTHISRIKSISLDNWTNDEINFMQNNGNKKINDIFESNLHPHFKIPTDQNDFRLFMHNKYVNKKYKGVSIEIQHQIKKRVEAPLILPLDNHPSLTLPLNNSSDEQISLITLSQPNKNMTVPSNNELIKADIIKLFNNNPGNYSFGNYNFSMS